MILAAPLWSSSHPRKDSKTALRKETAIGCAAFVLCIGALSLHWMRTWQANRGFSAAGAKLVVFGPSSWDAFAPGAAETVVFQVMAALDRKFQLAHPELKNIVHDSRGTVADGLARLRNAQVAGDQLDVVICAANPVNTVYARAGLIVPLDSLITRMKQRFTQDAIENFNVDGHLWAAPLSAVNLTTFIYNRDLFAKIGAEPPTTYAEFQTLVPKFKAIGIIPVVHQGKNSWMWLLYYMSALAQVTNNNQVSFVAGLLEGREKFTGSVNLRALQLARNWVDDGLLDPQSNELDEDAMTILGPLGIFPASLPTPLSIGACSRFRSTCRSRGGRNRLAAPRVVCAWPPIHANPISPKPILNLRRVTTMQRICSPL